MPSANDYITKEERTARVAAWLEITTYTDLVTFFLSTTINGILLNLIKTESPKHFGNYVYLMMAFSINSLVFAAIHAFIQPIISTEKYVVFVFTSTNYLELPRRVMGGLLAVYGTSYSQTLIFIAIQFIYRFFTISRRKYLHYFKGNFLAVWFAIVGVFGVNWGLCIFFIAQETEEIDEILRPVMMSSFELNMTDVYYVAASYEIQDDRGRRILNWKVIFMVLNFACILGISLTIIILCICFIHYRMQRVSYSKVYKSVQKQLFRALISQMIIPLILIYVPIICVLILPLFHFKNDASISVPSILISLYPVLEPFAVIMIISVYRNGFYSMFSSAPRNRVAHLDTSGNSVQSGQGA
uniref:Seven TM Receptor n=2 Tax=Caenorhabditis japonica TaxID=281687 RepID=A0A8R1HXH7_CAEJA